MASQPPFNSKVQKAEQHLSFQDLGIQALLPRFFIFAFLFFSAEADKDGQKSCVVADSSTHAIGDETNACVLDNCKMLRSTFLDC